MTVATYTQPNYILQEATAYKVALDGAAMVHHRLAGPFACHAQSTPDLTARVDAGVVPAVGAAHTEVAGQDTASLTAPSANPRYDIVYVDQATGTVGVATGSESATPSDPAVPAGKVAVARIAWTVDMTEITDADITDLRALGLLGLGTAAVLDTGKGEGNLVILGAGGTLPAGDGSALTGVGGQDQIARDMAASAMIEANMNGVAGTKGALVSVDPFTADTLATKTNALYSTIAHAYQPTAAYSAISGGTGTNVGDMTERGGLAAAFDGNTNQAYAASAAKTSTTTGHVGKQYSAAKRINKVVLTGSNDLGFFTASGGGADKTGTATVQASSDGSSWTSVSSANAVAATTGGTVTITDIDQSAEYAYERVALVGASGTTQVYCAEMVLYERGAADNMTLRPTAATVAADPSDIMAYFVTSPKEAITMGTDVVGKVSIDGGSTWADGDWTKVGDYGTDYEIWRLDADVSGQTGSSLLWEITTANNKEVYVKSCGGCVPLY
jgi:hypothetical protein